MVLTLYIRNKPVRFWKVPLPKKNKRISFEENCKKREECLQGILFVAKSESKNLIGNKGDYHFLFEVRSDFPPDLEKSVPVRTIPPAEVQNKVISIDRPKAVYSNQKSLYK